MAASEGARSVAGQGVELGTGSLALVEIDSLREEARAALERGEPVRLLTGTSAGGGRVETLLFATGEGAQSTGYFVHRGSWSGSRLLTTRGHLLDADGDCFCRDCEAAKGYTLDDDE